MSDFVPQKSDKFTFGLWTVGNRGRDPFGDFVRDPVPPTRAVEKLAQLIAIRPGYADAGDLLKSAREAQSQTSNVTKNMAQVMLDPHTGRIMQQARVPTLAVPAASPPTNSQALEQVAHPLVRFASWRIRTEHGMAHNQPA